MAFVNGGFGNFEFVQLRTQIQQQFGVESSSDLSRKNKVVIFVITDKKRPEPDPLALRIGKTTNQKILRQLAFHLQPLLRAAMLVDRTASLRNHAFPAFSLCARSHGDGSSISVDAMQWFREWQLGQQIATFFERECGHVAAVEPHDVKDVIRDFAAAPRDLAVENQFVIRQVARLRRCTAGRCCGR